MNMNTKNKVLIRALIAGIALAAIRIIAGPIELPRGLLFFCAPFLTAAVAPEFIVYLFEQVAHLARWSVHWRWQGRYYAYQGRHVRFYLIDGEVWAATEDVFAIVRPVPDQRELRLMGAGYALIPGQQIMGISEAALRRMMDVRTAYRHAQPGMLKFLHWLNHEALPNVRRHPDSSA